MPALEFAEEIIKRQVGGAPESGGQQFPTVAIVLLALLAIIMVFGIARVAMQAANKRETAPV